MKKLIITLLLVAGMGTALVLERQAQSKLRAQNQALEQQVQRLMELVANHRPVALATNGPSSSPEDLETLRLRGEYSRLRQEQIELARLQADNGRLRTNLVEQVLSGKNLSLAQVAPYLEAKQRSAESLLAAFHVTRDPALLREAVEKYPKDPRVNFAAMFQSDSPEDRRQRLDAFQQLAPDNALVNYLGAQEALKAGQTNRAMQELLAAASQPKFQDYSADFLQGSEEVYRAAGLSMVEAKTLAKAGLLLPYFADLTSLVQRLGELARSYQKAGDEDSAQTALQMGLTLSHRFGDSSGMDTMTVNDRLFGLTLERKTLEALDPASPLGRAGQTVKDRLDELARQRQTLAEIQGNGWFEVLRTLSEPDQLAFFDRMKVSGELEALRWARTQQGGR